MYLGNGLERWCEWTAVAHRSTIWSCAPHPSTHTTLSISKPFPRYRAPEGTRVRPHRLTQLAAVISHNTVNVTVSQQHPWRGGGGGGVFTSSRTRGWSSPINCQATSIAAPQAAVVACTVQTQPHGTRTASVFCVYNIDARRHRPVSSTLVRYDLESRGRKHSTSSPPTPRLPVMPLSSLSPLPSPFELPPPRLLRSRDANGRAASPAEHPSLPVRGFVRAVGRMQGSREQA